MSDGDDSNSGGDPYGGGGDSSPSTPSSSTPSSAMPSTSPFSALHQDSPNTPPSDTPEFNDGAAIIYLDDLLGGSDSSVSNPVGIGPAKGDSVFDGGVGGKGGLNVSVDGKEHVGLDLNADLVGQGFEIGIEGGGKSDGALVGVGRFDDLGGLVGDSGSLIDFDFGKSDGHTAALLDVVANTDADAQASVLGSDIVTGGSLDILGSSGLLDGVFDDCSVLS